MSNGYRDIFTGRYSYGPPKVPKLQTITERLRSYSTDGDFGGPEEHPVCEEAADVINTLVAALEGLVDHYAARTTFGTLVAADEQYPQIAKAMAALALARGEK